MSGTEIQVFAEIEAKPEHADALREVLYEALEPSRAEPGNREYILHEDIKRPGRFFFYETWADEAALNAHVETPHYKALQAGAMPLMARPLTVNIARKVA